MDWLQEVRWSPYVAGAGIGILSWFTFLLSNKPIGCSTAFSRTSGMIEKAFRGGTVDLKPYYQMYKPVVDWEVMLLFGIMVGSFISATLSGDFRWVIVPERWVAAFGPAAVPRFLTALIGGIFLGFGARWAGGCTSGHGISGTMQLAVSSWISAICFFIGGIIAAYLLYFGFGA